MISFHIGDASDPGIRYRYAIVHVLSDKGAYNAGFAKTVARRYPSACRRFQALDSYPLGSVQWVGVGRDLPGQYAWWDRWVVNMVAQRGLRSATNPHPLDLDALHNCLLDVAAGNEPTIVMPRIGCGLAGGNWAEVEPIVDATIGHLDVRVFDPTPGMKNTRGT
jgi:O-acetyl-ADP-ribose deacetylase (regulator of RNase III)